jgi:SAM-dependent methyltransferase
MTAEPSTTGEQNAALAQRYARRGASDRYHPLRAEVWQTVQERERAMLALFGAAGWTDLGERRITEVGCGSGGNLLGLLRLGARPEHLTALELLAPRHAIARQLLPAASTVWLGDARSAPLAPASQDLVLLFTVLSSLPGDDEQRSLVHALWRWLKPGGAVLCYDMRVGNPNNADVRAVPLRRLRALFAPARLVHRRVTLAPPLSRTVCRWHPALYGALNSLPILRSHLLTWIEKPR